ncbi:hypothetical protein C1N74_11590 [Microbacterium sp. SGAir0570]|nr:hypothetical protein C1N74_11590 [Microbacterium sp. SGAir0570]
MRMGTYNVPGVGEVFVVVDVHEFAQAGYSLRSVDSARHSDGRELSELELQAVEAELRRLGVTNQ